jgi:hypothetical protein
MKACGFGRKAKNKASAASGRRTPDSRPCKSAMEDPAAEDWAAAQMAAAKDLAAQDLAARPPKKQSLISTFDRPNQKKSIHKQPSSPLEEPAQFCPLKIRIWNLPEPL